MISFFVSTFCYHRTCLRTQQILDFENDAAATTAREPQTSASFKNPKIFETSKAAFSFWSFTHGFTELGSGERS